MIILRDKVNIGSSPRARGTHPLDAPGLAHARIIPASAGNTHLLASVPCGYTDHPRERGEHSLQKTPLLCYHGSSPRARGTPDVHPSGRDCGRIIPASAGNTSHPGRAERDTSDHPRERGEHEPGQIMTTPQSGSSPRARGTLAVLCFALVEWRIIPASAGNTFSFINVENLITDHPRERGEHRPCRVVRYPLAGSSPRARGTLGARPVPALLGRIIPASAGNTVPLRPRQMRRPDHPRERGEHSVICAPALTLIGSSPRARGTLERTHVFLLRFRIIPASAGNT